MIRSPSFIHFANQPLAASTIDAILWPTMSYFKENAGKLTGLTLDGQAIYRECQVGAAWAALAHFTASSEPALISMPTGSGKTALMMMLSFLLRAERVIIVTPSVVLRGQTAAKFESLADLRAVGAYPPRHPVRAYMTIRVSLLQKQHGRCFSTTMLS